MISAQKLSAFIALASLAAIPTARAADFSVTVGGPGILKYDPPFVNANPGDTVTFNFKQKNHTATQSTLASPCTPLQGGFDSGFVPVPDTNTAGPFPQAKFTVKDAQPVWVYCRQGNHCQQGMVFAINPADKFAAFQAAAMGNPAPSSAAAASSTAAPAATGVATGTATVSTSSKAPGSATPTGAISTDHKVIVGGPGKLIYSPSNITAQPGDTVTFTFMQKNHTVTQSTFASPCRALTLTSTSGQVGFDSGFMPVADSATNFPTYVIQVNDTAPIWAYCRQATHCGQGMVFSVNAVESGPNNFNAFKAKAIQQNGTASGTSSSATPSSTNGAIGSLGAGAALGLVGVVIGLLL